MSQGTWNKVHWSREDIKVVLQLAAALGIVWAWYMYAGCGPIAASFGCAYDEGVQFRVPSVISACLNLALTQCWRHRTFPKRAYAISGVVFSFLGMVVMLTLHSTAPSSAVLIATAVCTGLAYSSFLIVWIASSVRIPFERILASVFLATVFLGITYFIIALLGNFSAALSFVCPVLSCWLFLSAGQGQSCVSDANEVSVLSRQSKVLRVLYVVSLVLCGGVVRVLLVRSWVPPTPFDWMWGLCPLGLLFATIVFLAYKKATQTTMLAALGAAVCVGSVCALVLPAGNLVLSGLIFGVGWLLLAFSFAGVVDCFRPSIASASICIVCILLANVASGPLMDLASDNPMASPMLSIVFLGVALALAMMVKPDVRPADIEPQANDETLFGQRCDALAQRYDLTNREYDVLVLLAKGNSLKAIAEKLFLSENTVKAHRRRIYQKMDINSRQSLIDMIDESKANE